MENINNGLVVFIREKFPDVYTAFLTGSSVDEYFNSESDYDIYIITTTRDYVFNESFVFNGMKVQAVHLPLAKIDEILWYDTFSRSGVHLGAFKKAQILIDNQGYLSNLIDHCGKVYNEGPPRCSYSELKAHKIVLLNLISDLAGNNYNEEKIMISHDLYKAFIKFYLDYYGFWNTQGKHLAREIKKINSHLSDSLVKEIAGFHNSLNPDKFLKLIRKEMLLIDGIENGYSQYPGLISVKSNYLIINLCTESDFYLLSKKILNRVKSMDLDLVSIFTFRSRPLGDDDSIAETLYLVLEAESPNQINEDILPRIHVEFQFLRSEGIKIHYPVNFDFDIFLGGAELLKPIFNIFYSISNKYNAKLTDESASIICSLAFAHAFKMAFFNNEVNWLTFLNFVFSFWLPRAYDNKKIHSISQIINAKKNLLEEYQYQYNSQKTILNEILKMQHKSEIEQSTLERLISLKAFIKEKSVIEQYQMHPIESTFDKPNSEWIIYRNMLDYILGILLYRDFQKPYFIYILIRSTAV